MNTPRSLLTPAGWCHLSSERGTLRSLPPNCILLPNLEIPLRVGNTHKGELHLCTNCLLTMTTYDNPAQGFPSNPLSIHTMSYFKQDENESSVRHKVSPWDGLDGCGSMTFDLCPGREFMFWSLQPGLAALQMTSLVIFGPCHLLKSSAPAVLALRSWLKPCELAIGHTFPLLGSLWPGDISKRCNLRPVAPWCLQTHPQEKTICQEDTRFAEHPGQWKRERKTRRKGIPPSLHLWAEITWRILFIYLFFLVFRKRQRKRNPGGKCRCTIARILNRVLQMNL